MLCFFLPNSVVHHEKLGVVQNMRSDFVLQDAWILMVNMIQFVLMSISNNVNMRVMFIERDIPCSIVFSERMLEHIFTQKG